MISTPTPEPLPTTWRRALANGLAAELGLFRQIVFALAVLAVITVPTLYASLYLGSVWDPYGKMQDLPVAVVNNDRGVTYRGIDVHLGDEVLKTLQEKKPFRFTVYPNAAAAKQAVIDSEQYFAVILPEDFSARAIPGVHAAPGKLEVFVSEGTSYMAAIIGKRFAVELAHLLNERLNERRWQLLLEKIGQSSNGLALLRDGIGQLRDGSRRLADGTVQLDEGTTKLTDGMKKLDAGIRLMDSKMPADADLDRLSAGSRTVREKMPELADGLEQLLAGAKRLKEGEGQLREGSAKVPLVGKRIADGARQLEDGLGKMQDGLTRASAGAHRFVEGTAQLDDGVQRLTGGMKQLAGGIHQMNAAIPDDALLDKLADGAHQVRDGSARIAAGLDLVYAKLPASVETLEGDASGLAASIQPVTEITAPVANNGSAFAPYFMALALWVGAVMTTFILQYRVFEERMRSSTQGVKLLVKAALPTVIVFAQALLIALAMGWMGVSIPRIPTFLLISLAGAWTFLAIILMLLTILGDAGRLVALILLIVQLAAAGGAFPIELSAHWYQAIHPYLPVTDIVKAYRAALFGAYGGQWLVYLARMVATGAAAWVLAYAFGRHKWRFVADGTYTPALDL